MKEERPPSGSAGAQASGTIGPRGRTVGALLALALTAVPFLSVTYLPSVDLPQHLAQVRLLEEILGLAPVTAEIERMRVLWAAPNTLVYVPLFVTTRLFGPLVGGRLTVGLLALAWVAAIHVVAARRRRSPAAAGLAGLLVFSQSLYWGFLNFLSAVPFFFLLLDRAARPAPEEGRGRDAAALGGLALLTYLGHSLLFAVAAACVGLLGLVRRDAWKALAFRLGALVPVLLAALVWFPQQSAFRDAAGFDLTVRWGLNPLLRVASPWLVDALFGGLRGALEPLAALALVGYGLAAWWTNRRRGGGTPDRALLAVGGGLAVLALVGPAVWMNTVQFADRFAPLATALLVLGLPAPRMAERRLQTAALGLVTVFVLLTAWSWRRFERVDLAGLTPSLEAIGGPARVLGLDYARVSAIVKGRPFIQLFAYAQALHGGEGNFSFAEHGTGIVAYRTPRRLTWTRALEWFPELATARDLTRFDHVMVVGAGPVQAQFVQTFGVAPLVDRGHVRAYAPDQGRHPDQ